jgi:type II secretory pathway pseudopilin PulG
MLGNARRSGLTLVEILAVVVIVIILALMLLPLIGRSTVNSNQQKCGKNQAQIMGACVAYAQQEESAWPAPWANTIGSVPKGQPIAAGVAAMEYAFGCFEVLAKEASIPNGLFRCPAAESPGPNTRAQPGPPSPEASGSNWADAGGGSSRRIGYAFDWASPGDPGAARVVFSDRDPLNHKRKGVMACFGDSHTKFLKVRNGPPSSAAPNETIGMIGARVVVGEFDNPDAAGSAGVAPTDQLPDSIFSSAGDIPAGKTEAQTALTPGEGDPLRAFVK